MDLKTNQEHNMPRSKKKPVEQKAAQAKPASAKKSRNKNKGKKTRVKILVAASHVFSSYAYRSATLRMIGKEAGIEFPLISYYFPNKADLFVTVLKQAIDQHEEAESEWLEEVKSMSPARGLSVYIDHQLDFFRRYPGVFCIIALNKIQSEDAEPLPGYHLIQDSIEASVKKFMVKVPMIVPKFEVELFCRTFLNHMTNFLGAAKFHASIMSLEPDSIQYMNWVKDATLYVFLPRLEMMVQRGPRGNV